MSNDNSDLQALFDEVASGAAPAPAPLAPLAPPAASASADASGDSDELQALFDQAGSSEAAPSASAVVPESESDDLFVRIGGLARKLHDALRQVGEPNLFQNASANLPESRQRLSFIADLMENAANQCLALAEREMPLLETSASALDRAAAQWEGVLRGESDLESFKTLARSMPSLLSRSAAAERQSKQAFMDIIMAQDFQDLAGQTLAKVISRAEEMEEEILRIMALAAITPERKERLDDFLSGPQFKPSSEKTDEAVHTQAEVDDLLKDLGF